MIAHRFEPVPAHVRHARRRDETRDGAREQAESGVLAAFVAAFVKNLHADADAEKRLARAR